MKNDQNQCVALLEDLKPDRAFIVYSGEDRYPKGEGIEVIGVTELATLVAEA